MREEIKEVPNQREVSTKRKWLGDLFTGNRMMTLHKALAMYKEVFHYFSSETSPSIETVRRAVVESANTNIFVCLKFISSAEEQIRNSSTGSDSIHCEVLTIINHTRSSWISSSLGFKHMYIITKWN